MLRPRLLTSSAPQSAWRTRRERRSLLNFHRNIKDLFVNLSQRRFLLKSGPKKILGANASEKWSKMKRGRHSRDEYKSSEAGTYICGGGSEQTLELTTKFDCDSVFVLIRGGGTWRANLLLGPVTSSGRRSKFWRFRVIAVRRIGPRAILLTLDGWTRRGSPRCSACARIQFVWRGDFARGGVEAIKASVYAGPPPVKTEPALRACAPLLEAPVAYRCKLDDPAPHRRDQKARTRRYRAIATLPRRCEKKLPVAAAAAHAEGAANRG